MSKWVSWCFYGLAVFSSVYGVSSLLYLSSAYFIFVTAVLVLASLALLFAPFKSKKDSVRDDIETKLNNGRNLFGLGVIIILTVFFWASWNLQPTTAAFVLACSCSSSLVGVLLMYFSIRKFIKKHKG